MLTRAFESSTGTDHQLAARSLTFVRDLGDPFVGVFEHLTQHKDGALFRLQFFEKVQKSEREAGLGDRVLFGSRRAKYRFGQPLTRIHLAPVLSGTQSVDCKPRRNRGQPRFLIYNRLPDRLLKPQQGLLHYILGFRKASQITIRKREKPLSYGKVRFLRRDRVQQIQRTKNPKGITNPGAISS